MPLHADVLGFSAGSLDVAVDARWAMAYAAGVPDTRPELYDTAGTLTVHPMLAVAVEWQLLVAHRSGGSGLTAAEVRTGIHVGHDLVLDRALRSDEQIHLEARTVAVDRRRAGATQTVLFTATDSGGAVVWRTANTSLFLGVELVGEPGAVELDWPDAAPPIGTDAEPVALRTSEVRALDAHVYSECARIWNPIHTDVVAARRAGLAAPILHGTATMARAVGIVAEVLDVPLAQVRRVAGRFSAPVDLATSIEVRVFAPEGRAARFDVLTQGGAAAISGGLVAW